MDANDGSNYYLDIHPSASSQARSTIPFVSKSVLSVNTDPTSRLEIQDACAAA
jgi:hypothetical protein